MCDIFYRPQAVGAEWPWRMVAMSNKMDEKKFLLKEIYAIVLHSTGAFMACRLFLDKTKCFMYIWRQYKCLSVCMYVCKRHSILIHFLVVTVLLVLYTFYLSFLCSFHLYRSIIRCIWTLEEWTIGSITNVVNVAVVR